MNTCVMLMPGVFDSKVLETAMNLFTNRELLFVHYGEGSEYIPSSCSSVFAGGSGVKISVMNAIRSAEAVCCIAPGLGLMEMITAGKDEEFFAAAVIKAVLMGKRTEIVTDFDCSVNREGRFFKKVWGILEDLRSMGIGIQGVHEHVTLQAQSIKDLITEADVISAASGGNSFIECSAKGIVTPLAIDTAKRKDIKIIRV